jgi:hypothetical protein
VCWVPGFASEQLVLYVFAMCHKPKFGGTFPFGELAHESPGELVDCVGVPTPDCLTKGFTPGVNKLSCARTVPKLYLFPALGIALSEKQIPQVVVNIEN